MRVTFLFSNPRVWYKKFGNTILKIAEGVPFGHFSIQLDSLAGSYIYESIFPRSQKLPLKEWLTHYEPVYYTGWDVPDHMNGKVLEWLESMTGKRYALEQILFIAFCICFKWVDILFNTLSINHAKALVCTEYGSRFVERFTTFKLTKSHDKIGLKYMLYISKKIESSEVWKNE